MNDTETTITIVLAISEDISNTILEVKRETGVYYPDHEDSIPHITLYSCKIEESKYEEVLNVLSKIKIPSTDLTLSELKFQDSSKRNYTFVHFDILEKENLQSIHETVLKAVNPLRGDLVRNKDIERFKSGSMTEEEFAFTQKYGFLYFMEKYNPHITIGTIPLGDSALRNTLIEKLSPLEGKTFSAVKMRVKLKTRSIPSEKVLFDAKVVEIPII